MACGAGSRSARGEFSEAGVSGASSDPGLDVLRIMRVLDHHGVEYLLVGGAAAVIHGAERQTQDFDCVAQSSRENLHRLALAMRELNARLHVEGLTDAEASTLPLALDAAMLARMEISTWRTDAGDLDILADIPDRHGQHMRFEELIQRADSAVVGGLVVRVASLDDIIGSKVWADRPKDREALPELQRLHAAQDSDPGSRPPEPIPPAR